jgi:hypothetical protein
MERRKAFATAGAVSVTALVAVVALGANVGLFGLTGPTDGPGQFKLVGSTQQSSTPQVGTDVVGGPVPVAVPGSTETRHSEPAASNEGSEAPRGDAGRGDNDDD